MNLTLLDTDMLSELLKQRNPAVTQRAAEYLKVHGQFAISAFTRFEIIRGYKERGATSLLARFDVFCCHSLVLPVTQVVFDRASDLWAIARRGGHAHGDADLIIAATALDSGRELVTGNTKHFLWIPGIVVDDWRTP
ncbi:MAG: type II toxin-antitoxin system VapC family toxin [Planctomycetaceae bacterium]|nr:MAG: type II toxin-antitoxin system VapC family toxin [Planctomycetaceae bacterium]